MSTELFELKVIVEADGWHDIAGLMDTIDRALDPHQRSRPEGRRWSVVAARVPDEQTGELLSFIDGCAPADDTDVDTRLSA